MFKVAFCLCAIFPTIFANDCRSNPVLKQTEVTNYLENFQLNFFVVTIDKVFYNVAIICKKCYVEIIFNKICFIGNSSNIYGTAN